MLTQNKFTHLDQAIFPVLSFRVEAYKIESLLVPELFLHQGCHPLPYKVQVGAHGMRRVHEEVDALFDHGAK